MSIRSTAWEIRCEISGCDTEPITGEVDPTELHPFEAADRTAALAGWGVGWGVHHCPAHVALALVAAVTGHRFHTTSHMSTRQNEATHAVHRPDSP